MVMVKLIGGLGNQMFQYAAARRLAEFHNTVLKLDITELEDRLHKENFTYRSYSLNVFHIKENIAQPDEIISFKKLQRGILSKIVNKIKQKFDIHLLIREKHFHFDEKILHASNNSYLDGYWQSEQYFKDIEDIIRQEFIVKLEPDKKNRQLIKYIQQHNAVSIHVRRGDYISNPSRRKKHLTCDIEYYHRAVKTIVEKVAHPHFIVFSDDPEWTQNNLKLDFPAIYITHNQNEKAYEDLRLMSLCKHNIISNSSFSWWGAWISANKDKIVITPKKWFNDASMNTQDLIPEKWIRL